MMVAFRALAAGVANVLRAPMVLVLAAIATVATVVPFGLVLGDRVQTALAHQPPIDLAAQEIDAEWWMHFRAQARGLESTFAPTIIGFAAPLDNVSALLDRSPRPAVLAVPVILYLSVWAFLWGGAIDRFHESRGTPQTFLSAGSRHFRKMFAISALAAAIVLLLYATLHRLLFEAVYPTLAEAVVVERDAFAVRVGLYLVFGLLLAAVSVIADYTRVHVVRNPATSVRSALVGAVAYVRAHPGSVLALFLLTALLFVLLMMLYGLADRRLGGWRAILASQAFIVGRLTLRMLTAASQVQLVRHTT